MGQRIFFVLNKEESNCYISVIKQKRAHQKLYGQRPLLQRHRFTQITLDVPSNSQFTPNPSSALWQVIDITMGDSIDLTGDGGVLKTIIRQPKPDAIAPSESLPLVDVHYEGVLSETGEVFDSTHEDNTVFSFEVGKGSVIRAWDVALRTMKVGEVAKITCKPDYAYGSAGSPPEIPPDATLVFEVELVACRPRKGSSLGSVSDERARLDELKKQRELAAAVKEEEKKKREEAKAAAAARIQAKLDAKKGPGKGKGKGK